MKVAELLQEDWTGTITGFLEKIKSDGTVSGRTVTVGTEREKKLLTDLCKERKVVVPNVVIKALGEETVMEKRPPGAPAWKDSDAPDAKGKFKELGVNDLADWLIRTRGGNMQKITGSLNQQIVFNRNKNPAYAKKMESVRAAVKRKLAARKEK